MSKTNPLLFGCVLMAAVLGSDVRSETGTVFLTLEDAINRALTTNNQIRASEFGLKRASWDQANAWTLMLPQLSLNSRYMWIDDETFAQRDFRRYLPEPLRSEIPQTVFQEAYFTSLDVSMPVFNAGILNGLSIAKSTKKMAMAMNQSTRENVLFQVVSVYLNLKKMNDLVNLQKEYEGLSKRNFEKAERMGKAGRYSNSDVLRWKIEFEQQKSIVVNHESMLRSQQALMSRLLNLPRTESVQVGGQLPDYLITESEQLEDKTNSEILALIDLDNVSLVRANAALKATEAGKETALKAYRGTLGRYLPSLNVSYQYAWRENNSIKLDDYQPQTFMVNLSVPLFTGFQNLSGVKSSYYAYKENEETFLDQLQNTRFILTDAANRLINLKAQRALAKTNLTLSESNYSVIETQKDKGLVSNLEFIDAKLGLQNARMNELTVYYDTISTLVELYFLTGRLDSLFGLSE